MFSKHVIKVIFGFCSIILFGLISLVVLNNYKNKGTDPNPVAYIQTEDISGGSVNALQTNGSIAPPEVVKLLSYQEAVSIYAGKIIEIDSDCKAVPNTMTFKNNTKVMINNNSDTLKTLKVGKSIGVNARSFKIVNLSSSKLPNKLIVDCNTIKGIANISLYK